MIASLVATVRAPVADRAQPFDSEWLRIVVVVSFEFGHTAAALAPDGHDDPAAQNRFPDNAVGTVLFGMPRAVSALCFAMSLRIPAVLSVDSLVLTPAISTPALSTVRAQLPTTKFAEVLFDATFCAEFHQNGTSGTRVGLAAVYS